jgi:hypothetical protein
MRTRSIDTFASTDYVLLGRREPMAGGWMHDADVTQENSGDAYSKCSVAWGQRSQQREMPECCIR